jgi:glycosyltransferase involved in cell wall biosynthesis
VKRDKLIVQPIWSIFQEVPNIPKDTNPFLKEHKLESKFVVQYSGNIGLTHKVEVLVEIAELLKDQKHIVFQIIGRGPRVPHLKRLVEEKQLPNCTFLPFQLDEMFPFSLAAADLGVVILDELTSKGSVPSKSYNLMSYGIPSLYIAAEDSELNDYANKFGHARCFSEQNIGLAVSFILKLSNDKQLSNELSLNAITASKNFRRSNADLFVEKYIA